ncbi:MAG: AAA family ATPase [Betaproteobacteria bacterium]|nr:AAA family ATPase [Betaproteobacteria bacterium]
MYEAFYGLTCRPFQLNPDPSFYFSSTPHRKAMAYLEYGLLQNGGFVVVTGEAGAGKTTLVRSLLRKLDGEQVLAATLVSTPIGAQDMLRTVAAGFGVPTQNAGNSELLLSIQAFLTSVVQQGKQCLLVVDEAQNLTPRAVEELRTLTNFQLGEHALLQCFLVGQAELRSVLQRPAMRQRVIAACHIGPLDADETRRYIEHRLACAGSTDQLEFQPGAYLKIFQATGGIPRRINSLCDRLLLSGFLDEKQTFAGADVATVVAELDDELRVPEGPAGTERSAAATDADWEARLSRIELSLQRLESSTSECAALVERLCESLGTGGELPRTTNRRATAFPDFPKSNESPENMK